MNNEALIEQKDIERIFTGFAIQAQKQLPDTLPEPKKRVIVLAGPTACGKTAFAVDLAQMCYGEIISADSMQVYKGMDIGTAKPTNDQRAQVPHHLVDIRELTDTFNVVDFYFEARHHCQLIHSKGNTTIITGGSGFYVHSLIYGPPSGPPSVPELRQSLEEELEKVGLDAMYEKLRNLDLRYANSITRRDKHKIIRGLEIITLTGKPVSTIAWKSKMKPQNYDFRCWFLYRPREVIYKSIEDRCDAMLEEGFLDEVRELEKQGLRENTSASQAIGYRQALDFLQSPQTDEDYEKFVKSFKQASRNYAKRQFTWFRREPFFRWLDLDLHDRETAMDMILADYESL